MSAFCDNTGWAYVTQRSTGGFSFAMGQTFVGCALDFSLSAVGKNSLVKKAGSDNDCNFADMFTG